MGDLAVRLDKWLWAARFFKTRALARAAVDGGLVHLNGARVKPSRQLKLEDQLQIQRSQERFDVVVAGLSNRRGPAVVAAELYTETAASIAAREKAREERRLTRQDQHGPARRPDKRGRRQLGELKKFVE